ncbi:MAG: phosphatase PAP2 family protein [Flavobacteriales bacterium]|nr:phosphatase PAP2 family protein [Flavobacteriales bacterium]MCB9167573.1 phosphatase PAP2 family protein [Flavobacteriales bacterium]
MIDTLNTWDHALFLAINGHHAPWADTLLGTVSIMAVWFPLYVVLLWMLYKRHGRNGLLCSLPVIALMIYCSDTGSVLLFKNTVQRLRPCHEPGLEGMVHLINAYCGGSYGFVSSHASNHFAIAAFMMRIVPQRPKGLWPMVLLGWATLIAYSRVYAGVHFPGDVLVGALYGFTIGSIFFAIFQRVVLPRLVR